MKVMKKGLAASLVSAALFAAGPALAAIDGDDLPLGSNQFAGPPTGTGEIFASIVARGANPLLDQSIVIDTGIAASSMINALNSASLGSLFHSIAPDANLMNFLSNNTGKDISFNVMAVHNPAGFDINTGATIDVGMLTTSAVDTGTIAANQPIDIPTFGTSGGSGRVNNLIRNANLVTDLDPVGNPLLNLSSIHDASSLAFHDNTIGGGSVFGFNTEGVITSSVEFFFLELFPFNAPGFLETPDPDLLGTWTLFGDGTLEFNGASAAPVPLPAGVWLMGSALVGMAGVARRRKA